MTKFGDIVHVRMSHIQADWSVEREDRLAVVDIIYCHGCICDSRGFQYSRGYGGDEEPSIRLTHNHNYRVLAKTLENYLLLSTEEKKAFRRIHGIQHHSKNSVAAWFEEQEALLNDFQEIV